MLRYELENADPRRRAARCSDLPDGVERRHRASGSVVRPPTTPKAACRTCTGPIGSFGYFPSYALGALIAAQLYETSRTDLPALDEEIAAGQFGGLLGLVA